MFLSANNNKNFTMTELLKSIFLSTIKTHRCLKNYKQSNTVWEKMFGSKKTWPGKIGRMVALRNSGALARFKTVGAWSWTLISTHTLTWRSQIDREASFVFRPSSYTVNAGHKNLATANYRPLGPNTMRRQRTQPPVELVPEYVVKRLRIHGAMPPLFHGFAGTDAELSTETTLNLRTLLTCADASKTVRYNTWRLIRDVGSHQIFAEEHHSITASKA
jgi:hypothetical protein